MPPSDNQPLDNGSTDAFDVAIEVGGRASSPELARESRVPGGPGGTVSRRAGSFGRRWWIFGLVAVAALGLFYWQSSSSATQYTHTPGQGHVHASAVLPMPGTTDKALWLGVHDGLFLKLLAPGGTAGWRKMRAPFEATDVMAIGSAQEAGGPIYAAGHDIGVQRSDDSGANWRQVMPGAPARDVHALAVDPQDPARVYVWAEVAGLFTTSNGGATWEPLGGGKTLKNPVQVTAMSVGSNTGVETPVLYAGTNLGLFLSKDGGESWSPSAGEAGEQPIYALLVVDRPRAQEVYVGTATGMLRSSDGAAWERIDGTSGFGGIGSLAYFGGRPDQEGVLLAVNGASQLFGSVDGGETFRPIP